MKISKSIAVFIVMVLSFSYLAIQKTDYVKAEEKGPLKIEKIIGLSKEPGTFRRISQEGWDSYPKYQQGLAVASDGTIYIGDDGEGQIEIFGADLKSKRNFGSLGTESGQFQHLASLMIDEIGQIYAVDSYLANVQVFNKEGNFLKKFGIKGKSPYQLRNPTDIAKFSSDELMISDAMNGVKIYSIDGKYIRDFSKEGPLRNQNDLSPMRVKIDKNGIVYICLHDSSGNDGRNVIATFDQTGHYLGTVFENFSGFVTDFTIDGQFIYIGYNKKLSSTISRYEFPVDPKQKLKLVDKISVYPKELTSLSPTDILSPSAIAVQQGKVYYLDGDINRLVVVSDKLEYIGNIQSPVIALPELYQAFGKEAYPLGILENPQGIKIDYEGRIFVVNNQYTCISVFDANGSPIANFGSRCKEPKKGGDGADPGELWEPSDIAFDASDNVFVSDPELKIIQCFNRRFRPRNIIRKVGTIPNGIIFDNDQNLLVVDSKNSLVITMRKTPNSEMSYGLVSSLNILGGDWPLFIDSGPNNKWATTMYGNEALTVFDPATMRINFLGKPGDQPGYFRKPKGVLIDGANDIYLADSGNGRIQKISSKFELSWCQNLNWNGLASMAMDKKGKIYITDSSHGVVLVLSDRSITPREPVAPPPDLGSDSDAEFSFSINKEQITEGDTFTLFIKGDKLEQTAYIELTLQYPNRLLTLNSTKLGDFLKNNNFQDPSISPKTSSISIKSTSNQNKEINGSGILFELDWTAVLAGPVLFDLKEIKLLNAEGKTVTYTSKEKLSFTILSANKEMTPLKIKPIPEEVDESNLLLEGETDPEATVTINKKEVKVNNDGSFSTILILIKGVNTIKVEALKKSMNKNIITITVTMKDVPDTIPPMLKIKPIPEFVFDPFLQIEGETEVGAKITINQKEVNVGVNGKFGVKVDLSMGINTIKIVAIDKAKNETIQKFTITRKERIIIKMNIGSLQMYVNRDLSSLDAPPFIDKLSGRTMVPVRAITQAIGCSISYDAKEQRITISLKPTTVQLWIGKPIALVNGKEVPIDQGGKVAPVIVKGRTFVPLRFVAETFEFKVEWEPKTQEIRLTYPKE